MIRSHVYKLSGNYSTGEGPVGSLQGQVSLSYTHTHTRSHTYTRLLIGLVDIKEDERERKVQGECCLCTATVEC